MLDAASVGLMCVTKAHRQWAPLRRFSVVMMPRFSVFEKASSAQRTGKIIRGTCAGGDVFSALANTTPALRSGRADFWSCMPKPVAACN